VEYEDAAGPSGLFHVRMAFGVSGPLPRWSDDGLGTDGCVKGGCAPWLRLPVRNDDKFV
jgi:hypothetical protein